jgi:hypothetical protein
MTTAALTGITNAELRQNKFHLPTSEHLYHFIPALALVRHVLVLRDVQVDGHDEKVHPSHPDQVATGRSVKGKPVHELGFELRDKSRGGILEKR